MRPQCSWMMLIGFSAHCAKVTQDIAGHTFSESAHSIVELCLMFSFHPLGFGEMHCTKSKVTIKYERWPRRHRTGETEKKKIKRLSHDISSRKGCGALLNSRPAFPSRMRKGRGLKSIRHHAKNNLFKLHHRVSEILIDRWLFHPDFDKPTPQPVWKEEAEEKIIFLLDFGGGPFLRY